MKRTTVSTPRLVLVALALAASGSAIGQSNPYAITKSSLDGGGGRSTGGIHVVHGTIGQPDAASAMTGGAFALTGGFWTAAVPAAPPGDTVFSNGFE